ncbi:MAG: hypothetical protein JXR41_05685 [Bacteroidales bacterium]|nr:hypothetical protein [Bacteroidales bacterium]MBN2762560.1 hypothetical protein [Bacteroidales bacterium]
MIRNVLIIIIIVGIIVMACEPPEKVSPVPEITFKEFLLEDNVDSLGNEGKLGTLKFDFIDGDADIGSFVYEDDTSEERLATKYNVFLIPFEKMPDGFYDSVETDPLKYIIRHNEKLDRVGQNKTIKGEMKISIQYSIIPSQDTLRYEFYIRDRAMNQSNMAYTTDIGFH